MPRTAHPHTGNVSAARRAVLLLLALLTGGLSVSAPAAAASAAAGLTPPVAPATAPDDFARYVGQVSCEQNVKPGTLALRDAILRGYGRATIGTLRACSQGGVSEHKDGRALDWMLDASDPVEKARADAFLAWLTGPDARGVVAGNARRLGVMYVIWNRQTWASYRPTWKTYTGSNPHTDHIHISLSWDGAMQRTSWWTGVRTDRYDYGPCRIYVGEVAPPYAGPRYSPCPAPVVRPVQGLSRLWDADRNADVLAVSAAGAMLLYPGNGGGGFLSSRQIASGWAGMNLVASLGDFDGDGRRDLAARDGQGRLFLYPGNGLGGFLTPRQIGTGWAGMSAILGVGDLDGDGAADVVARRGSDDAALLYPGNGRGGFRAARPAGGLGGLDLVTAVGDWDGDRRPDVVAREPGTGGLLLHPGTAAGGLGARRTIGTGWGSMTALLGTGDFSGDGAPDIIARHTDGTLWLYRGDGRGGFLGAGRAGSGWGALRLVG